MNTRKLKAKMVENKDTLKDLSTALSISTTTCSMKVNQIREFTLTELQRIKDRYNLTPLEFEDIFFGKEVS